MVFELRKRPAPDPEKIPAGQIIARESSMWPAVVSMLTSESWPDGSKRVPSSLTLFWHDGSLKACLNDKDADVTAWVSADTLEGLLEALEVGLQGDRLDWRKGGKRTGKKR